MKTRFVKGRIYRLNKVQAGHSFGIPTETDNGNYCIVDCQIVDKQGNPKRGYEYPVPVQTAHIKHEVIL